MSSPPQEPLRTRITDLLDAHGVRYRWLRHSEPVFTVEQAVRQRGVLVEEMVKSILLVDHGRRYAMACVRGDARVDPQAVRAVLPDYRRLHFATAQEILAVTGSVQGAVAPLALPADVPVVFDEAIARCARVNISSGDPRAGLELPGADLIRLSRARLAAITR